jgi:hypothetical protein
VTEHLQHDPAEREMPDDRTAGQKLASGRPAWTPFAALGTVAAVIAVLVAVVIALAALAYFLA